MRSGRDFEASNTGGGRESGDDRREWSRGGVNEIYGGERKAKGVNGGGKRARQQVGVGRVGGDGKIIGGKEKKSWATMAAKHT
jgi:hypothetical protein